MLKKNKNRHWTDCRGFKRVVELQPDRGGSVVVSQRPSIHHGFLFRKLTLGGEQMKENTALFQKKNYRTTHAETIECL